MKKLRVIIAGVAMLALLAPCLPFALPLSGSLAFLGGTTNLGVAHTLLAVEANTNDGLMARAEVLNTARNMGGNTVKWPDGSGPFNEVPALPATTAMFLFGAQLVGCAAAFRRYVKE